MNEQNTRTITSECKGSSKFQEIPFYEPNKMYNLIMF